MSVSTRLATGPSASRQKVQAVSVAASTVVSSASRVAAGVVGRRSERADCSSGANDSWWRVFSTATHRSVGSSSQTATGGSARSKVHFPHCSQRPLAASLKAVLRGPASRRLIWSCPSRIFRLNAGSSAGRYRSVWVEVSTAPSAANHCRRASGRGAEPNQRASRVNVIGQNGH